MPNGEGLFKLPAFPTQYTEQDVTRLQQLEEQRKAMTLAYGAKFSKEAWARVPAWEKLGRGILPTWTIPAIKAFPGVLETWEYGFTPEQFEGTMEDVEKEYQEIVRRKKVTSLLPNIQAGIMLTALKGEPILDTSELLSTFPELRSDFTDEEINYLARFSQVLATATPEDILSGSLFGYDNQLPISQEDIEALFPEGKKDPRFLLSTVAFSKDLEEITSALQEAYPAEGEEKELSEKTLEEIEEWYRKLLEERGVIPKGFDKVSIQEAHKELADKTGSLISFKNEETGELFSGLMKEDGSIWEGEELIGYYNEETKEIVPFGLDGTPLVTEEITESKWKDVWDAFYSGVMSFYFGSKRGILTEIPLYFLPALEMPVLKEEPAPGESPLAFLRKEPTAILELMKRYPITGSFFLALPREIRVAINEQNKEVEEKFLQGYATHTEEYRLWVEEHPELKPRAEWAGGTIERVLENPMLLADPAYIAFVAAESAAFMGAFWGATAAVGYATKNPYLGMMAGVAVTTPFEIDQLQTDLVSVGVDPRQAIQWAVPIGGAIASVEMLGGFIMLRAIGLIPGGHIFYRTLKTHLNREIGRALVHQMVTRGLVTLTEVELGEILEEVIQSCMHNALVRTFDDTREVFSHIPETMARTALATLPLGTFAGGVNVYQEMKSNLPLKVQDEIDADTKEMVDKGVPHDQAETEAYLRVVETETGQQQVLDAVEKAGIDVYEEAVTLPVTEAISHLDKGAWLQLNPKGPMYQITEIGKTRVTIVDGEGNKSTITNNTPVYPLEAQPTLPVVPEVPLTSKEITNIEKRIASYNAEIGTIEDSLEVQRDRLQKMIDTKEAPGSRLEQHGIITHLEESLEDFKAEKALAQKKLAKAREEVAKIAPPAVPEVTTREMPASWVEFNKYLTEKPEAYDFHRFMELYSQLAIEGKAFSDELVSELFNLISKHKLSFQDAGFERAFKEAESTGERIEKVITTDIYVQLIHANMESLFPTFGLETLSQEEQTQISELTKKILDDLRETNLKEVSYTIRAIERAITEPAVGAVEEDILPVPETMESTLENPVPLSRRPRLRSWGDEQEAVAGALEANPIIASRVWVSTIVKESRVKAWGLLTVLQTEFQAAKDSHNKEAIKAAEKTIKDLASEAGLHRKALLGKQWGDLPPNIQADVALAMIPDKSLTLPKKYELFDVKHYVRFIEENTGQPFYQLYPRARLDMGASARVAERVLERLKTDPYLRKVRQSKEAQVRATQQINSKNPNLSVLPVEDLTLGEEVLISTVEDILKHYEPYVRYLRVEGTDSNLDAFKEEFPDAVDAHKELELQVAIDLKENVDYDGLWSFLNTVSWGTMLGYTPWMKAKASIFPKQIRLGTTRGEARLMRRESIEFDDTIGETLLLDVVRYVKQIEAQWRLRPTLEQYEESWQKVKGKFTNSKRIEENLKKWAKELQGMPVEGSALDDVVRRIWRQSMSAIFLHPYMAFRNIHQAIAFHPDRTELFRLYMQKLPPALKAKAQLYYDSFVHQLGGIKMDFLLAEGQGVPGFGWLNKLSDALSQYAHSDNIPRMWSFLASTNKAWRATEKYLSSNRTAKDLDRWIKKSGVNHLTHSEKNYALQLLAQGENHINLALPGLHDVTGAELASFYIGHEMADVTHFLYQRWARAMSEMGSTGRILYNLIVFPRGYGQRWILQATKVKGMFHPDTTWEEARAGFKDMTLLLVVGAFISQWLVFLTGRPRRSYNPLTILPWQLGGLAIGVGLDLTEMIATLVAYLDQSAPKEEREAALSRLPGMLERNAQTLVPFYRNTVDAIESALGVEEIGVHTAIRQLRGILDENYDPPEVERLDRTLWDKIRHAVLSSQPLDETEVEKAQVALVEAQDRLGGKTDPTGKFYTIGDFGSQVASSTKNLPDYLLTEDSGFSPLAIFYFESRDKWEELYTLPSTKRDDWRKEHIEEEAMLLFWEKYKRPVFTVGSPEATEVRDLLLLWFDQYEIDKSMHQWWVSWELPVEIPTEE